MNKAIKKWLNAALLGLSVLFNDFAALNETPETHLRTSDVIAIVGCGARTGERETSMMTRPNGDTATYICSNREDGKTFDLGISYRLNGKLWETRVLATEIHPDTLEIQSIVFDNEPETLRNAKEIYSVLNHIGQQVRGLAYNSFPRPHKNEGRFSPIGRFMPRMLPKPSQSLF